MLINSMSCSISPPDICCGKPTNTETNYTCQCAHPCRIITIKFFTMPVLLPGSHVRILVMILIAHPLSVQVLVLTIALVAVGLHHPASGICWGGEGPTYLLLPRPCGTWPRAKSAAGHAHVADLPVVRFAAGNSTRRAKLNLTLTGCSAARPCIFFVVILRYPI